MSQRYLCWKPRDEAIKCFFLESTFCWERPIKCVRVLATFVDEAPEGLTHSNWPVKWCFGVWLSNLEGIVLQHLDWIDLYLRTARRGIEALIYFECLSRNSIQNGIEFRNETKPSQYFWGNPMIFEASENLKSNFNLISDIIMDSCTRWLRKWQHDGWQKFRRDSQDWSAIVNGGSRRQTTTRDGKQ